MHRKVINLDQVTKAILPFLEEYLEEHGIDTSGNFNCINPKHEDNTPSMSTKGNSDFHIANCFSCGASYSIFQAAHFLEGKPIKGPGYYEENILYLADKYGVKVELEDLTPEEIYEFRTYEAYKYAEKLIKDVSFGDYSIINKEIERRGWDKEKCSNWGIGTVNYQEYKTKMKDAGYDVSFLNGVDLDRSNLFDNHNLLFTIYDDYGRPVGFSAKNLKHDGNKNTGPKYINTRGTGLTCAIFKKGERLYGFDVAKNAHSPLFIFEGQADVITARHHGLMNCCCSLGTALTDHHINLLKKHGVFNIVLVFDSDKAGEEAALKALDTRFANERDFRVKLMQLPAGLDPDDLLRENGIDKFHRLKKWTAFEWRMMQFVNEAGEEIDDEKCREIAEKMSQIIVTEKSHVRQEEMAKQVAKMTGYSLQTIMSEVKRLRNEKEAEIQDKKRALVESMMHEIRSNPNDIELTLTQCQTALADINNEAKDFSSGNTVLDFALSQKELDEAKSGEFAGYRMRPEGLGVIAEKLDDDWKTGAMIFIGGSAQASKCVKGDARVLLSDGTYKRIEDLYRDKNEYVIGMSSDKKLVPMKVKNWIDSGKLKCFKVETSNGISTSVSETHPYYTLDGWKKVKELKTGDKIAITRNYDCFNNLRSPISEEEAEMLALFLAEGSLTNGSSFSNTDEEVINHAFKNCQKLWYGVSFKRKDNNTIYIKDDTNSGNRVIEWLKKYELINKTAHQKSIPDDIFKCSLKRIGKFLGMFWAGDGWVHFNPDNGNKCEVGLALCNYKMLKQIRSLLLRFGIKTSIREYDAKYEKDGKVFKSYSLSIRDIENIKKFYNNIRIPLKYKQDNLKAILDSNRNGIGSYNDNLPAELWTRIIEKTENKGWTLNYLLKMIGEDKNLWCYDKNKDRYRESAYWKPKHSKRGMKGTFFLNITPRKLRLIGNLLQDQFLIDIADGDIYFDEITSIEDIGIHQCYDLEVPGEQNFIVEDTVVHNTTLASQMAYEVATCNEDTMCIYHSIDDAAKFILYKWICQAHNELVLELNHVGNPNYWSKQEGCDFVREARELAYKRAIDLIKEEKLVLLDASNGNSLAYIEAITKQFREKYPSRNILLFGDNFHKYPDYSEITGRERVKRLSNNVKNMTTRNNISVVCTVEYRKLNDGEHPSNLAIAESNSLVYDPTAIIHLHNELHHKGEHKAILVHDDRGYLEPRIWCKFGKNKHSGFEGRVFLDLYAKNATLRGVDTKQAEQDQKDRSAFIRDNTNNIHM